MRTQRSGWRETDRASLFDPALGGPSHACVPVPRIPNCHRLRTGCERPLTTRSAPAKISPRSVSQGSRVANKKHVARLKQGSKIWNKWRKKNPDIRVDLRKADLQMADLQTRPPRTISQSDFRQVVGPPLPCRLVGPNRLTPKPGGSPLFTLNPLVTCQRYEPRDR
jgi:hypothetical protein